MGDPIRRIGGSEMSDSAPRRLEALAELVERLEIPAASRPVKDDAQRWLEIDQQLGGELANLRALVVGGDVAHDAQALVERGAGYVLGCLPAAHGEPRGPKAGTRPAPELRPLDWRELDPERHGRFELVLCSDLLHRVTEPLTLLQLLRTMMAADGTLLIGAVMLEDPERSEYLRFIPDRYAGDASWWFVPGRLAFRWLLQVAGFEVDAEFAVHEVPGDLVAVVAGYLRATAR